jgi:hypothetical protein
LAGTGLFRNIIFGRYGGILKIIQPLIRRKRGKRAKEGLKDCYYEMGIPKIKDGDNL